MSKAKRRRQAQNRANFVNSEQVYHLESGDITLGELLSMKVLREAGAVDLRPYVKDVKFFPTMIETSEFVNYRGRGA
jgi:hypothetical protein